jgi:hypothetical protein
MEGVSPSGSELHWPTNGVNLSASQDLAFPFRACLILDDANSTTASSLRRCKSIDVVEVNDRRRSERQVRQRQTLRGQPSPSVQWDVFVLPLDIGLGLSDENIWQIREPFATVRSMDSPLSIFRFTSLCIGGIHHAYVRDKSKQSPPKL